MKNEVNNKERVYLLNIIAEKDAEHEKMIVEKNKEIEHYKRKYEIAVERRLRERHERSERRKDLLALAVTLIAGLCMALPVTLFALVQFWEWANGG